MFDLNERTFIPVDWAVLGQITTGAFSPGDLSQESVSPGGSPPGCDYAYRVFEAEETVVVLGRSSREEEEVELSRCEADGVPVLRRAGGGGTVVLAKGIVVVSVAGRTTLPFHLKEHMNAVNGLVISVLERLGVQGLSIQGISDIACRDRKVAGSSLYRTRDIVLYQGSILVQPDFAVFDRYLRDPKKEPDYRRGRGHRDFLTSLRAEGFSVDPGTLIDFFKRALVEGVPWRHLRA